MGTRDKGREIKRKRAYEYMVSVAYRLALVPDPGSVEQLAGHMDVSISALHALKNGKKDPYSDLVDRFKQVVCPEVSEAEVDEVLTKPFL